MEASPLPINEFLAPALPSLRTRPSFRQQLGAHLATILHTRYYAIATIYAALESAAELMELYTVFVVGTYLVPRQLRFKGRKRSMRIELLLWDVAPDRRIGYLLRLVHNIIPLVAALPGWRRQRNCKNAFSPVGMTAPRIPSAQVQ